MALRGIRVIELSGLAPGPLCGMILADHGASVIQVDKVNSNTALNCLSNGKKSIALNLKKKPGGDIMRKLLDNSDVLIEPFRAGVMESLNLGPKEILARNPKLVYARLTGFGQNGSFAKMAGHDINYLAMSGVLSYLGRAGSNPTPPINLLADFGGGGLMCALGIMLALFERNYSKLGQVVDASMVDGTAYLSSWLFRSQTLPIWGNTRGNNILDCGSHFYDTYETKDGKYMAVGALEPQFFSEFKDKLGLPDMEHFSNFDENKKKIASAFKTKTQSEWCALYDYTDACVTPVLTPEEAESHPHNVARQTFASKCPGSPVLPNPAPKLSRTPAISTAQQKRYEGGAHTREILQELGYSNDDIIKLKEEGVIYYECVKSKI